MDEKIQKIMREVTVEVSKTDRHGNVVNVLEIDPEALARFLARTRAKS